MKKVILTLAIIAQSVFVFAEKPKNVVYAKHDQVKMYQQAGTASTLLKALPSTAEIEFVRKFNDHWSIVIVDGQFGYVLTSELYSTNAVVPVAKKKVSRKAVVAQK